MSLGDFLCPLGPFVGFRLVCYLLLFLVCTVVVVQWIWFVVFDEEVCSRLTGFVIVLVVLVGLVEMFRWYFVVMVVVFVVVAGRLMGKLVYQIHLVDLLPSDMFRMVLL
jgi:hypothetical protein